MAENDDIKKQLDRIEKMLKTMREEQKTILRQMTFLAQNSISFETTRRHDRQMSDHRWHILADVLGINAAIDDVIHGDAEDESDDEAEIPPHIRKLLRGERGG